MNMNKYLPIGNAVVAALVVASCVTVWRTQNDILARQNSLWTTLHGPLDETERQLTREERIARMTPQGMKGYYQRVIAMRLGQLKGNHVDITRLKWWTAIWAGVVVCMSVALAILTTRLAMKSREGI